MKSIRSRLLVLLTSIVGFAIGAVLGLVGVALLLGVATRSGDLAVAFAIPGAGIGGIGGAAMLGLLVRRLLREPE